MVLEPNNTLEASTSPNLASGFDEVVDQLRDMMGSLQFRVSNLTNNLRVASEVSTQIATILDLEQLLPITVETVKERFGLYHAHIYLYDPFTNMLVMKAGSGEAGRMMKSAKHQIPLDAEKSLVARAARNDQPEVIKDVLQEPNYLPNPLLPHTRSEMAIPLSIGERVLGVLDVQAVEVGFFNEIDIQVHSTLADQLAVAIENAEIFSRMQDIQFELEQRNYEMEIAAQISSQVANILQLDELLPKLAKSIANGFNINRVNIFLLTQEGLTLVASGKSGKDDMPFDEAWVVTLDSQNCFLSAVARAKEPMLFTTWLLIRALWATTPPPIASHAWVFRLLPQGV
ncbi:MAG: GAF domain-containing protein [Phototrophicaceae bacterium]